MGKSHPYRAPARGEGAALRVCRSGFGEKAIQISGPHPKPSARTKAASSDSFATKILKTHIPTKPCAKPRPIKIYEAKL